MIFIAAGVPIFIALMSVGTRTFGAASATVRRLRWVGLVPMVGAAILADRQWVRTAFVAEAVFFVVVLLLGYPKAEPSKDMPLTEFTSQR